MPLQQLLSHNRRSLTSTGPVGEAGATLPNSMPKPLLSIPGLCLALGLSVTAADWLGWRGPDGSGISPETGVPLQWGKNLNVRWKTPIPGKGASSPIVVGNRLYLTSQTVDQGLHVIAVDVKTGGILWDREIARGKLRSHDLHNMATPTAVSDGRSIWVLFGTGDYAALDLEGKVLWQHNFVKESGPIKTNHGYGTSPVLHEGKLFLALMHQGPSWVMAVDAKTGKVEWKKDRMTGAAEEAQDSYSSPFLLRVNGAVQLVCAGAEVINAYHPTTGEEIWTFGGLKVNHPYGRTIAGPAGGDGVIAVVASGFQNRGYTVGIRAGGKGNITETHKLWTSQKYSADCPTPLLYQGKLYSIRDDGNASCLDAKTGEVHWQERLFTENVKVSPVAADGRVYFTSGQGNCHVVKASATFEVLARNELNETTLSTPAIAGGRIYLRTDGGLYCVGAH